MSADDRKAMTAFSYYIENNTAGDINAFAFINGDWKNELKGNATVYNIETSEIKTYSSGTRFKVEKGFKGYVVYDIANCKVNDGSAADFIAEQNGCNIATGEYGKNELIVIKNICMSNESFETVDAYFRSRIKSILVNDGTNGSTGSIWTPIKGTSSHGYNFVTVDGISPDGTAIKLEYTEEELESRSHNGDRASECGIGLNFTPDKELLSQMQVLSYYVNLAEGDATNLKFSGLKSYNGFNNAPAYAYDLRTKTLTKYDGNISLTSFEGYIIIDLRNATLTSSATPWADYILANGISGFQFDLVAKSFVNRPLVIDSVIFSRDYTARLAEIMAK